MSVVAASATDSVGAGRLVVVGTCAVGERDVFDIDAPAGFVEFYEMALPAVHRHLSRLTGGDRAAIEEVTQETFVGLARQVRAGTLRRASIGLAVVAARHRFLDGMRRGRAGVDDGLDEAHVVEPDVAVGVVSADAARRLLARLTDEQRAAVVLHHLEGLPVADVAALLERSVHATESLIARALRTLRAAPEVRTDG